MISRLYCGLGLAARKHLRGVNVDQSVEEAPPKYCPGTGSSNFLEPFVLLASCPAQQNFQFSCHKMQLLVVIQSWSGRPRRACFGRVRFIMPASQAAAVLHSHRSPRPPAACCCSMSHNCSRALTPLTTTFIPPGTLIHSRQQKAIMTSSRCLQFFVLALVAATGLASESVDTSNKPHANLRYVQHTPRDMHAFSPTHTTVPSVLTSGARFMCAVVLPTPPMRMLQEHHPPPATYSHAHAPTHPNLTSPHHTAAHCSHHPRTCTP